MVDESRIGAEAIIRLDSVPDSMYVRNAKNYPGIIPVNNYLDNCKNGKNACTLYAVKGMRGIKMTMHGGKIKGNKSVWNVSCAGTVIGRRHVMSARHCFCRDGGGYPAFGYTAGFWLWIAG